MNRKRIQFTRMELEIISEMCCIADAGAWGEGDYQNWDDSYAKPFDSLREKLYELIARRDDLPNNFKLTKKETTTHEDTVQST